LNYRPHVKRSLGRPLKNGVKLDEEEEDEDIFFQS
jgi:hypothetical protein